MPEILYFLASVGNLFLANFVILRARRARGAVPIAFLCLALFLWDVGESARLALGNPAWTYVRLIGSSLAPVFLWHFVLVFVHRERALRRWLAALYVVTAAFTIVTAAALFPGPLRRFVDSRLWNVTYLSVLFPFLISSFILIRRRRREVETAIERNALTFVAIGIAIGSLGGWTELTQLLWPAIPRLGHVGSALCAAVLAIAILRHRLLEHESAVRRTLFVFLFILSAAFVVPERTSVWLVLGVAAGVTLLAVYRFFLLRWHEQRERRERLALLGTMAAAVAHEIRNPLAAIKGAAQFVQKELEGSSVGSRDYLKLVIDETDRLNGVLESYLSYARPLEPRRQDVSLNALLADIVRLQSASLPANLRVETSFDASIPPLSADPALLTHAVTNIFRNAVEAMPAGGTLSVRTRTVATILRNYAAVEIADTGPGIDPRDAERIFQPFYTTKSRGTGLGLAVALRVAEAHGGELGVENVVPHGCRFTFLLPFRSL